MKSPRTLSRVVIGALLAVTMFAAPLASTASAIDVVPAPTPWGRPGNGNGGGGGGSGQTVCYPNGAGVHAGHLFSYSPYCASGGSWLWTGTRGWCPTGFEVFRFYGTVSNPVTAWTHGKVNIGAQGDNCATDQRYVASHTGHPEDAGQGVWPGSAAWRKDQTTEAGSPGVLPVSSGLKSAPNMFGAEAVYTTIASLNKGGDCKWVQATNTRLRSYQWGGSNYNHPDAARVRQWVTDKYNVAFSDPSDYQGVWAKAELDLAGLDPQNQVITGDGWQCSSAFDFMAEIPTGADPNWSPEARILGTCIVPTQRFKWEFSNYRWPWGYTGEKEWAGEANRPDVYTGWETDAGQNPALTGDTAGVLDWVRRNTYRSSIRSILGGTQSQYDWYQGHTSEHPARWAGAWGETRDGWVNTVASQTARCTSQYAGTWSQDTNSDGSGTAQSPTAVQLTVTTPEVAQVGGKLRDAAKITTRPGSILCGATACPTTGPSAVTLVSVDSLTVTPTAPAGTEMVTRTGESFRHARGVGSMGLDFFTATPAGREVTVTAVGTATVRYRRTGTGMRICWPSRFVVVNLNGCEEIAPDAGTTLTRQVPFTVTYSPDNHFPVIAATATPTRGRGN